MMDENLDYRFMPTDVLRQHWVEVNKMKTAGVNFRSQCRDMRFKSHQHAKAIKAMAQFRSIGKRLTDLELHRGVIKDAMVSRGIKFRTITGTRPKSALPADIFYQVQRAKERRKQKDAIKAARKMAEKEAEDAAKILGDIDIASVDMKAELEAEEAARSMVNLGLGGEQEDMEVDVKAMEMHGGQIEGDDDDEEEEEEMDVDGDEAVDKSMGAEESVGDDNEVAMILFGMQCGQ